MHIYKPLIMTCTFPAAAGSHLQITCNVSSAGPYEGFIRADIMSQRCAARGVALNGVADLRGEPSLTLIHVAVGIFAGAPAVSEVRRPLSLVSVPVGEDAAAQPLPPARLPGTGISVAVCAAALAWWTHRVFR